MCLRISVSAEVAFCSLGAVLEEHGDTWPEGYERKDVGAARARCLVLVSFQAMVGFEIRAVGLRNPTPDLAGPFASSRATTGCGY